MYCGQMQGHGLSVEGREHWYLCRPEVITMTLLFLHLFGVMSCERVCSPVVTKAPVAPQVLGSTPRGSEFLRI
jgi:hypothetical protein